MQLPSEKEQKSKKIIQTLLFSATLNTKVIDLGNAVLKNPVKLKLAHTMLFILIGFTIYSQRLQISGSL